MQIKQLILVVASNAVAGRIAMNGHAAAVEAKKGIGSALCVCVDEEGPNVQFPVAERNNSAG